MTIFLKSFYEAKHYSICLRHDVFALKNKKNKKTFESNQDKVRPEEKAMPAMFKPFILLSGSGTQVQCCLLIS